MVKFCVFVVVGFVLVMLCVVNVGWILVDFGRKFIVGDFFDGVLGFFEVCDFRMFLDMMWMLVWKV